MEEYKEKERQRRRRLNIAWNICGGWACSVFLFGMLRWLIFYGGFLLELHYEDLY